MPRASNGQYLPPANTAAVSGAVISSSAYNSLTGDIGTEITNSLDRGGRSAMTANLPMGGNLINNLGTPVSNTDAVTKAYADLLTPTGALMPFAMSTAPTGWLVCDGSAVSRVTYANLYAAIGSTWGAGDGSTTFNIPDLRGQFLRGFDSRSPASSGSDTTSIFGFLTSGSSTVTGIASTTYLYVGMPITGTGIPALTTIATIGSGTITLSANASSSSPTYSGGSVTSGSATVTVTSTTGLTAGTNISGTGIPAGAYVSSVTNSTTFVMSANATSTASGITITAYTSITVGRTFAGAQLDAIGQHNHPAYVTDPGHNHTAGSDNNLAGGGSHCRGVDPTGVATSTSTTGITVAVANSIGTETRPKNFAVLYCIKW